MLLVDLDGVLVDFVGGTLDLFGQTDRIAPDYPAQYDYWHDWGISGNEFWKTIHSQGPEWWEQLPKLPIADTVLRIVNEFDPDYRVCTKPSMSEHSRAGKHLWIEKHLGKDVLKRTHMTSLKEDLAKPDRLLIDDTNDNCDKFVEAGGNAVLVAQPWNDAYGRDPLADVYEACETHYALSA